MLKFEFYENSRLRGSVLNEELSKDVIFEFLNDYRKNHFSEYLSYFLLLYLGFKCFFWSHVTSIIMFVKYFLYWQKLLDWFPQACEEQKAKARHELDEKLKQKVKEERKKVFLGKSQYNILCYPLPLHSIGKRRTFKQIHQIRIQYVILVSA